jgi:hypothetical protein
VAGGECVQAEVIRLVELQVTSVFARVLDSMRRRQEQ